MEPYLITEDGSILVEGTDGNRYYIGYVYVDFSKTLLRGIIDLTGYKFVVFDKDIKLRNCDSLDRATIRDFLRRVKVTYYIDKLTATMLAPVLAPKLVGKGKPADVAREYINKLTSIGSELSEEYRQVLEEIISETLKLLCESLRNIREEVKEKAEELEKHLNYVHDEYKAEVRIDHLTYVIELDEKGEGKGKGNLNFTIRAKPKSKKRWFIKSVAHGREEEKIRKTVMNSSFINDLKELNIKYSFSIEL